MPYSEGLTAGATRRPRPVVDPFARCCDPLAGGNGRGVADHRHQFPVSPRLGPKDAEAVLGIVEGDALDETRQGFLGW